MKKRHLLTAIVTAIVAIGGGSASADMTYGFEDIIDSWTVLGVDALPLVEGIAVTYTHDLSDDVDFAAGDSILDAWLELDFTNDSGDGSKLSGYVKYDYREFVRLDLDGTPSTVYLGEVDNAAYEVQANAAYLNDNHQLSVTINVYNFLGGTSPLNWNGATAGAWLDHSRLYGTAGEAAPVPVPAAMLLGLLGLGTAGVKLRRRS